MLLIALALSLIGFLYFAVTVKKHLQIIYGKKARITPAQKWILHGLGYLHQALALYPCILAWEYQVGITVWVGIVHLTGFVLVPLLTYRPQWFNLLWQICMPGRLCLALTGAPNPALKAN